MNKLDEVSKAASKLNDTLTILHEEFSVSAAHKWQRRTFNQLPELLLSPEDFLMLEKFKINDQKVSELHLNILSNTGIFSTFSYDMFEKLLEILNRMNIYLDKIKLDQIKKIEDVEKSQQIFWRL
jgi:hypothetical protein